MMSTCIAKERGIGRGSVNNSSPTQVLQRSRKVSKDEMILRLGDGKAVAAEAVGSLRLVVSSHIRIDLKDVYFVPSMAFGRFKEYRLKVENQTNRKIKAIRSDRGGEYLSGEFIDYLKENGILSQWTPPGTPQLNGVAERRNRTLLDMTPYEIWHGKPVSYKYLKVWGSPAYITRLVGDKLDSRFSLCRFIGYPKETAGYYFYDPAEQKILSRGTQYSWKRIFHRIADMMRSTRESRVPDRYGFVGLTSQLDNDPKMYGEAMLDIDSDKWLETMKSEMDSMGSNQILLAIVAWYDYEIWQMDMKTVFLNGFVEEEIFMDQSEGFIVVGEEQKVYRLQRSIYGLKQASQSWNTHFDEVIRSYDFIKNDYDP
ncbi:UNVERIFIED_CONTAM: Retrovirus-related Pol polyprotein from transposon TNT 1-94 [Sesamum radiatum]|uniref:Retrovirus-related Pol polyprotein from transposon TNT 1-94 n=1 Tax=Sesamum radiatum TaxID=300843 RepID=A0AAW2TYM6_SESRA